MKLQDAALTRWTADPTRESQGLWFYVKDEDTGVMTEPLVIVMVQSMP